MISERGNRLDVVLKVSERCNLACPYCYYFYKENTLHETSDALIKERTVSQLARFLREGAGELNITELYIGLHGGEPLLLPKKRFDTICQIFKDELDTTVDLTLNLQTNATLIDDEWIDLFAKHRVIAGVSLDGPPDIHDAQRPDHKGRGSYADTIRGFTLLREAATQGRVPKTGILCVANPDYDGVRVVRHIVEDLKIRNFDLLLPREAYDSDVWQPESKWVRYFQEIFNYWKEEFKKGTLQIYNLSHVISAFMSEEVAQHTDWMLVNRHNIITVGSNGIIGPDDNLMALDSAFCRTDYTIFNTSLREYFATDFWQQFVDAVDHVPEKCSTCEWFRTCRSGALFNRYSKKDGFKRESVFCSAIDNVHTNMAALVMRSPERRERMINILSTEPALKAKELMQPQPEEKKEMEKVTL